MTNPQIKTGHSTSKKQKEKEEEKPSVRKMCQILGKTDGCKLTVCCISKVAMSSTATGLGAHTVPAALQ